MTTERIRVIAEYEIEYETPEGRDDAIASALDGAIDSRGVGMYGCYRATRGVLTLAGGTAIQAEESSNE